MRSLLLDLQQDFKIGQFYHVLYLLERSNCDNGEVMSSLFREYFKYILNSRIYVPLDMNAAKVLFLDNFITPLMEHSCHKRWKSTVQRMIVTLEEYIVSSVDCSLIPALSKLYTAIGAESDRAKMIELATFILENIDNTYALCVKVRSSGNTMKEAITYLMEVGYVFSGLQPALI